MNIKNNWVITLACILLLLTANVSGASSFTLPHTHVIPIKDTQQARQYELYIKLPEGYNKHEDTAYPVIYYTDAQWHMELLSGATAFLMENAILVGISWQINTKGALKDKEASASRGRDFSIRASSDPKVQAKHQLGQANNHLAFIRNDIIQYIENQYNADPNNRTYFGFSFGGLFGSYILMAQPDTFKNYILGSPSLWRDIPHLLELGTQHKQLNANVFISYGALEDKLSIHVNEFVELLHKRNDKSLKLQKIVIESAGHSDSFPMLGVRSISWLSALISGQQSK
ncbi:alpha/beta hydrolase [Pseudoalteromonas aurantia]|uniref:Alpha/beta hydrolase n=1 Tax=Pseudoalteromonas aurantia 208 TaxID=1314867 RepID=A0ABR9EHC6_9GAMM|nr:alpha/beta hydrolase-fold protein [Pseudoalteromonas aurantia]MBE0370390.1 hypothetical protein [Pseudoalteromonas aurantia 208]